jgi:hypothetical protein
MIWDGLLLAIVLYNMLRGANRGGRMVAAEVGSFVITYAATFTLGPIPAAFVRSRVDVSPFLVSFVSALAIYLGVRQLFRVYIRSLKEAAANRPVEMPAPPVISQWTGAAFGALRGGIAAIAIAVMVSGVARLQNAGMMHDFPAAQASVVVAPANGLIGFVMHRYTRFAGPTTKKIVDLVLEPDREAFAEFLHGPFVTRVIQSEPVRDLARDEEVRRLREARRTGAMLLHPAFLRVVDFVMTELRNESDPATPAL